MGIFSFLEFLSNFNNMPSNIEKTQSPEVDREDLVDRALDLERLLHRLRAEHNGQQQVVDERRGRVEAAAAAAAAAAAEAREREEVVAVAAAAAAEAREREEVVAHAFHIAEQEYDPLTGKGAYVVVNGVPWQTKPDNMSERDMFQCQHCPPPKGTWNFCPTPDSATPWKGICSECDAEFCLTCGLPPPIVRGSEELALP